MNTWEAGELAEAIALLHERSSANPALLDRVRLVSDRVGLGYDIESVDNGKTPPTFKAIEVKAWNKDGFFIISKNEVEALKLLRSAGWIYLVDISKRRVVEKINDPFGGRRLRLEPVTYRCFF
jgi:hypothetical protein